MTQKVYACLMQIRTFLIPCSIIAAAIILSVAYYLPHRQSEHNRVRQQYIDSLFDKRVKCETLSFDLAKQFNNIASVYYKEDLNTCMVRYFTNNTVQELTMELFQAQ
jgi:hypothetical protein